MSGDLEKRPTKSEAPSEVPVSQSLQRVRLRRIIRDLAVSVALTLALIVVKEFLVEHSLIGRHLRAMGNDWLQSYLGGEEDSEIAILDISPIDFAPGRDYTPREKMQHIIDALLERKPVPAIGFDVNFSPKAGERFIAPGEDASFFYYCLSHGQKLNNRLVLGINDSVARGRNQPLGAAQFDCLSAYIGHLKPDTAGPRPEMIVSIKVPYLSDTGGLGFWTLPSLPLALASSVQRPPCFDESLLRNVRKVELGEECQSCSFQAMVVDFGHAEKFQFESIPVPDDDSSIALLSEDDHLLNKRFVLVGRVQNPDEADLFAIPGHTGKQYPGVVLMACELYTLLHTLYVPSRVEGALIEGVISIGIFGFVAVMRLYYNKRRIEVVATHRLGTILTGLAVLGLVVFGVFMLPKFRFYWEAIPVVIVVFLLHHFMEPNLDTWWHAIVRRVRATWEFAVFGGRKV